MLQIWLIIDRSIDGLPAHRQTVTHPSTNPAVHSRELNSQPVDHESDALTTTPPSHPIYLFIIRIIHEVQEESILKNK